MTNQDLGFNYQLKRTGFLDGLKLTISHGRVKVTAGKMFSQKVVEEFLLSKRTWILESLEKSQNQTKNTTQEVEIFGKKYQKEIGSWNDRRIGVSVEGERLYINLSGQVNQAQAEKKLADFLKLTAEKYIRPRINQLALRMKLDQEYNRIVLKQQSTRWGSCSSNKNLNFNWTLVHYEPKVIDYVLIHELAHLREMNHSPRFWKIVAEFDPEYKKHRRILKN